jgi:single-strand DNA-binding protein
MASLNRVSVIGNLGRDPEVRTTPSGSKVASFSLAVTERFKDKNGQQKETTEWVNVVLWKRQAEICEQYLRKGSSIYLEGKMQTQTWDDPNGVKRSKVEVVGSNFQMLGSKSGESKKDLDGYPKSSQAQNPTYSQAPITGYPSAEIPSYEDNMPF